MDAEDFSRLDGNVTRIFFCFYFYFNFSFYFSFLML